MKKKPSKFDNDKKYKITYYPDKDILNKAGKKTKIVLGSEAEKELMDLFGIPRWIEEVYETTTPD